MVCKQREKVQHGAHERVKPNAFRRALGIFEPRFTGILRGSHAPLSNEEIRTVEAHRIEVERRRSMAIEYSRRNTYG